jgi:hypothetical protein
MEETIRRRRKGIRIAVCVHVFDTKMVGKRTARGTSHLIAKMTDVVPGAEIS